MSVTDTEVTEPTPQEKSEPNNIQDDTLESKHEEQKEDDDGRGRIDIDHDAQEMVISSLRTQIQDLFSQVHQLNSKLVLSYDRVSDLEDSLHVASTNLQLSNQKLTRVELEKSQHLSQLTSGLLVEKTHVTAELTRLMERATEEAAQRGQAENAKEKIERELEELSASLFGEANAMVEEARIARSLSERKVEEAEGRLREAEEAVRVMQSQMQTFMQEKEDVGRRPGALTLTSTRNPVEDGEKLMKGHLAYQEYLAFLAHLRHLHASNPSGVPPAMATLLQLPFLSRLSNEDAEPTLRFDLAPSLNWLSRRSVLSAIHTGQLSVEPISAATLFTLAMDSTLITVAGMAPSNLNVMTANREDPEIHIPCALCGTSVFDTPSTSSNSHSTEPFSNPILASVHNSMPSHATWSAATGSFFRKPSNPLTRALSSNSAMSGVLINGNSNTVLSRSTTPVPSTTQSVHPIAKSTPTLYNPKTMQTQVYIFRLASPSSSATAALSSFSLSLAKSSSQPVSPSRSNFSISGSASSFRPGSSASVSSSTTVAASQPTTFYPLCTSGWCLARLRATCTLWSFIRTGIVEKIWEEEVSMSYGTVYSATSTAASSTEYLRQGKAPPLPPRRRGLWGIASALGERAASWGEGVSKEKRESKGSLVLAPSNEKIVAGGRDASIKAENSQNVPSEVSPNSSSSKTPPPLPKRNANRSLPQRGESTSPTLTTLAGTTDSTDIPPRLPVVTSPAAKSPHKRNASLSQAVSIPLPESRAGTPSPADGKTNLTSAATPTPSRTTSPAPPAGGAPPPVPRRAARRNKGVVGSASDGAKAETDQPDPKTGDGVETPADVKVKVAEGTETEAETANLASDKSEEIVSVPAEQEKSEVVEVANKKTEDGLPPVSESPKTDSPTSVVNGVAKPVEDEKVAEEPSTEITSPHHEEQPTEASSDADPSDDAGKVDQVQYVGTSTWEEKTWRELVRIRKDLFYARIGAVDF